MKKIVKFFFLPIVLIVITGFFFRPFLVFADTVDELKQKITDRETAIKKLEADIAVTQKQIDSSRGQQQTLKNTIAIYDAERKKILTQIKITEEKISSKELEIESLGLNIKDKAQSVEKMGEGVGQSIRNIYLLNNESSISVLLNNKNMSLFWNKLEQSAVMIEALNGHIKELKLLKAGLEKDKVKAEKIRSQLQVLKKDLSGQRTIAESAKAEQERLLMMTKNQESEYQKLLKTQLATRDAFEKELLDFESALRFEIDANSLPQTGTHILRWPLDIAIKITQYFGKTTFADAHPKLYSGAGHNGIDLRAPVGTPVKSASSGKVVGLGNTDTACPGASYGKWVLIEHGNGLSTLYAHLSAFAVNKNDSVLTGDTIGWSGNTGYSTGPHLHFTVYATQGVRIMDRKSKVCSGTYTMPVADLRAYLNPLAYL
jgi:murein DD-endopeptidase MepM/ murein hydrolase activator NlpD